MCFLNLWAAEFFSMRKGVKTFDYLLISFCNNYKNFHNCKNNSFMMIIIMLILKFNTVLFYFTIYFLKLMNIKNQ